MFKQAVPFGLLAALAFGASAQETSQSGLKFSGYYKSLLEESETIVPGGQRYLLDLNRLRLQLQGKLSEHVAVDLQYDNELLFGSYLHTAQFASQSSLAPDQYLDLDGNYLRGGSYYGQHRLYRGNVTLSSGDTDVRIGRQRIAWGTGRFWSPLDLLNPEPDCHRARGARGCRRGAGRAQAGAHLPHQRCVRAGARWRGLQRGIQLARQHAWRGLFHCRRALRQ